MELGVFGIIWNYFGITGITWKYLKLHGNIWNYLEILGIIWKFLELLRNIWNYLEIFGIILSLFFFIYWHREKTHFSKLYYSYLLIKKYLILSSILSRELDTKSFHCNLT